MTEEQRKERIHYHMYETCEGIEDHAERIVDLEGLVLDLWRELHAEEGSAQRRMALAERMRELDVGEGA